MVILFDKDKRTKILMEEKNLDRGLRSISIKVVLLGYLWVGKTCLFSVMSGKGFDSSAAYTIGSSLEHIRLVKGNYKIEFELWDTTGDDRYQDLATMYYRNAKAAIAVYDITSKESFEKMKVFLSAFFDTCGCGTPENLLVIIVGNKSDLNDKREVTKEEGEEYAKSNGFLFIESSAKLDDNVSQILDNLADKMVSDPGRYIEEVKEDKFALDPMINNVNPKKCC